MQQFSVTHPFHPLYGQEYDFITQKKCWGEDRVLFYNKEGELDSMPTRWTSVAMHDSFLVQSTGRCVLHFEDLHSLALLLQELKKQYLKESGL